MGIYTMFLQNKIFTAEPQRTQIRDFWVTEHLGERIEDGGT